MLYVVSYSLNNKVKNYQPLYDRLKSISDDVHQAAADLWFIKTSQDVHQITYAVCDCIDKATDRVFVADITGKTMNGWLYKSSWNWINSKK